MKKIIKSWLLIPSIILIIASLIMGSGFYFSQNTEAQIATWTNVLIDTNSDAISASVKFNGQIFVGTSDTSGNGAKVLASSNGTDWNQVNSDGWGDNTNTIVSALGTFNNYLYAGTTRAGGAEIWRCSAASGCNEQADWAQVCFAGWGTGNTAISSFYEFNNWFYAGTFNAGAGLEIRRCDVCDNNADWDPVDAGVFGLNNIDAPSMTTFGGNLFVGTYNGAGSQVHYCSTCAGGGDWAISNNDGFGNVLNDTVQSLAVFNNELYAGTRKGGGAQSAEMWKTSDMTSWSQVGEDGFGQTITEAFQTMLINNGLFYMGTAGGTIDTIIWKSSNGENWNQKNNPGFDNNITTTYSLATFNNYLYAFGGSMGGINNGVIYRADLHPVVSSVSASQSTDGDGKVAISFQVSDPEQNDVRARIEYSTDGGATYNQATISTDTNDTTASFGNAPQVDNDQSYQVGKSPNYYISTPSSGTNTITTAWNSKSDVPSANTSNAMIKIIPNDLTADGDSAVSAAFSLDNVDPAFTDFKINPQKATKGTTLKISFTSSKTLNLDQSNVTVDNNAATLKSADEVNNFYKYTYKVTGKENDGNVNVVITGKDSSGNSGTTTETVDLDFTAPTTKATPSGGAYNSAQKVKLTANESATIYYTTDGSNPNTSSSKYTNKIKVNENATLKFFGIDSVGNQESINTEKYTFDYTAPTTTANPPGGTYENAQAVTLESSEAGTIYYTTNGHEPTTRSDVYNAPLLIQQNTTLKFFGIDKAGNQENPHTEQYIITSTSPYITLTKSFSIASSAASSTTGSSQLQQVASFIHNLNAKSNLEQILLALISLIILISAILIVIAFFKNKRNIKKTFNYICKKQKTAAIIIILIFALASISQLFIGVSLRAATIYQGNILTYRIDYTNKGGAATEDLRIVDSISSSTTYQSSSMILNGAGQSDAKDNDKADYDATNSNAVTFDIGQVNSNASGSIEFKVQVNSNTPAGADVSNKAIGSYNPGAIFTQSNTISNTVYGPAIGGPFEEEIEEKKEEEKKEEEKKIFEEIIEEITEKEIPKQIKEILKKTAELIQKILKPIQELLKNKLFQDITKNIIAPLIAAIGILNILAAIPFIGTILPYLGYLLQYIIHPTLFFGDRKRWGVVYNSLTKEPIDLAIVRLFDKTTGKLKATRITDFQGRFLFLIDPGEYYMTVTKPYYNFPAKLLETKSEKEYMGETISVQSANNNLKEKGFISFNIPLDPKEGYMPNPANPAKEIQTPIKTINDLKTLPKEKIKQADEKLRQAFAKHKSKNIIAILGPIIGLICLIISPSILTFILFIINLGLLLLFRKLAKKKFLSWGKTFDLLNKKTLPKTIVRLFDTKYNRLLLTDVSKNDGRYGFLVGKDRYILTSQKDDYKLPHEKTEVRGDKEGVISKDLGMEKLTINN